MAYKVVTHTPRLAEHVKTQLKQSIFDGEYPPGNRLPSENELVNIFGVSRVIVREAIRDLERSGMVNIRRGPKGGAYVNQIQHDALSELMRDILIMRQVPVFHIMEVRLLVEPEVASLAAERATDEDIERIEHFLKQEPEAGTDEYIKWNVDFHRHVVKCSHNKMYEILLNILLDFSHEIIIQLSKDKVAIHDKSSHPEILRLIKNRDRKGVKKLFRQHLEQIAPKLEKLEKISFQSQTGTFQNPVS